MEIKDALSKYGKDRDFTREFKGQLNGKTVAEIKHLKWERLIHKIKYTFSEKYKKSFETALKQYNHSLPQLKPSFKKLSIKLSILPPPENENATKIKGLEKEILSLEEDLSAHESKAKELEERIGDVNRRIAELEGERAKAQGEVASKEEALKPFEEEDIKPLIKEAHEETLKAFDKAIKEKFFLANVSKSKQQEVDARRAKLRDLKAKLQESPLNDRKRALDEAKINFETTTKTLEDYISGNPLESSQEELSAVQKKISSIEKQIQEKKNEIVELKGEAVLVEVPDASPKPTVTSVEETPDVSLVALNEHSIKFLDKIENQLGQEAKELWEILLTRFANEYKEDRMTSFEERNGTVKLNFSQPLMIWLLSLENGVEDPVGGIITLFGSNRFAGRENDHEVVIKFEKGKMVFEKGYESFSPLPKKLASFFAKLGMTTTDATIHKFEVDNKTFKIEGRKKIGIFNKSAEKVKTFDEIKASWSKGGEVLKADTNINEYLNQKIEERKRANNPPQ